MIEKLKNKPIVTVAMGIAALSIVLAVFKLISTDVFGVESLFVTLIISCYQCGVKAKKYEKGFNYLSVAVIFLAVIYAIMDMFLGINLDGWDLLIFGILAAVVNIANGFLEF